MCDCLGENISGINTLNENHCNAPQKKINQNSSFGSRVIIGQKNGYVVLARKEM